MSVIDDFDNILKHGLRPNRYRLILTLPSGVTGDTRSLSLMVKATNVPSMETGVVEVNYKGKVRKYSGDERPAGDWTCTAYLNMGGDIAVAKKVAEQWQKVAFASKDPQTYKSTGYLEVLHPDQNNDSSVLSYEIQGIWCSNSGELSLGDDETDSLIEFDLVLNFDEVKINH